MSLAVLAASLAYAIVFTWRARRVLGYSMTGGLRAVLLGVPFLGLTLLRNGLWRNVELAMLGCVGYLVLVVVTRQVSFGELRALLRAVRANPGGRRPSEGSAPDFAWKRLRPCREPLFDTGCR
ncbi:MAG: hypothetical protein NTY23_00505 [Chloroflexi bacterium]|nr:hypothetical protein [Chloroflexota bacterium]